jgi:hypothetical protein
MIGCEAQDLVFDGGQALFHDALLEPLAQVLEDAALSGGISRVDLSVRAAFV